MYLSIYLSSVSRSPLFRGSSKTSTENAGQNETLMKQINEKMFRKKLLKHNPEWSPGGPLGVLWRSPGGSLEASWHVPGASGEQSGPFLEKSQRSFEKMEVQGSQTSPFWDPAGPQKSTKDRSLAPKVVPRIDVSSIFPENIVFLTFGLDFSSNFH